MLSYRTNIQFPVTLTLWCFALLFTGNVICYVTVQDADDCATDHFNKCSDSCIEKVPEQYRDSVGKCVAKEFVKIHNDYNNCMRENGVDYDGRCYNSLATPEADRYYAHSKERKPKPSGSNLFAVSLMNLKKCETDCLREAQEACTSDCEPIDAKTEESLSTCVDGADWNGIKADVIICIQETLGFRK